MMRDSSKDVRNDERCYDCGQRLKISPVSSPIYSVWGGGEFVQSKSTCMSSHMDLHMEVHMATQPTSTLTGKSSEYCAGVATL